MIVWVLGYMLAAAIVLLATLLLSLELSMAIGTIVEGPSWIFEVVI